MRQSPNNSASTFDRKFRLRELEIQEQLARLKAQEFARNKWSNPLIIAIVGAVLAALANVYVLYRNGQIEDRKAEQSRILEVLKTGDADKAAENLLFLLDAGLVSDRVLVAGLRDFLAKRKKGEGPTLNFTGYSTGRDYSDIDYGGWKNPGVGTVSPSCKGDAKSCLPTK